MSLEDEDLVDMTVEAAAKKVEAVATACKKVEDARIDYSFQDQLIDAAQIVSKSRNVS